MSSRFDYVKYDAQSIALQERFKAKFVALEAMIDDLRDMVPDPKLPNCDVEQHITHMNDVYYRVFGTSIRPWNTLKFRT